MNGTLSAIQQMMGNNAANSAGFMGGSPDNERDAAALLKALETGGALSGSGSANSAVPGQGAALKVESVDATLKVLEYTQNHLDIWKAIPKSKAYNTVEEYNQLKSYSATTRNRGFITEGALPNADDTTYVRRQEVVKFMGRQGAVTHPMMLVETQTIDNAMAAETRARSIELLRQANAAIAYGNSKVVPLEWNGVYTQHADIGTGAGQTYATVADYYSSSVVVDLRGASIKQSDIESASTVIATDGRGFADKLFAPPSVISGLTQDYFKDQRLLANSPEFTVPGRIAKKTIPTSTTDVVMQADLFLGKNEEKPPRFGGAAATSPSSPATPGGALTAVPIVDAGTSYTDIDGDYFFGVAAINASGESTLVELGAGPISVAVTQSVDLTFTDGAGPSPTTGYVIYRSEVGATGTFAAAKLYPIFSISVAELAVGYDGAVATKVRDRGRLIANTDECFLMESSDQVWDFKQLLPLARMSLAQIDTSMRFMVLLYGTPRLFAKKKMVKFTNIGPFV